MAPFPLRRIVGVILFIFMDFTCTQPSRENIISNNVRNAPPKIQKQMFEEALKQTGLAEYQVKEVSRIEMDSRNMIPDLIGAVLSGTGAEFLGMNSGIGNMIAGLLSTGLETVIGLFRRKKEIVYNMPPVIKCPNNIRVTADKGRQSALVYWELPQAFDAEDGNLQSKVIQNGGIRRSRWTRVTGEEIISYMVSDSENRNDVCQFYINVQVIRCQLEVDQNHRTSNCSFEVNYGESCSYGCDDAGYTLFGANVLTCTDTKVFDHDFPSCQVNRCPDPVLPLGGERWTCDSPYDYKTMCTLICSKGYRIDSYGRAPWLAASIKCQANETWTSTPVCKDKVAPSFSNCPGYIKIYADRGSNSSVVTWSDIQASDSNGGNVDIQQTTGPKKGSRFEKGAHAISYEVTDAAGLKDTCIFYINIETRSCRVPELFHPKLDLTCSQQFLHGSVCSVSCKQGITLIGATQISCEARNGEMYWLMPGGKPNCDEKECRRPDAPPNARLHCSQFAGGTMCSVNCYSKHVPARNAKGFSTMTCSPSTGNWMNAEHPGCVRPQPPIRLTSPMLYYWKVDCHKSDDANVTDAFQSILNGNSFTSDCRQCRFDNVRSACITKRKSKYMAVRWSVSLPYDHLEGTRVAENSIERVGLKVRRWLERNFEDLRVVGSKSVFKRFKGEKAAALCDKHLEPAQGSRTCAACAPGFVYDDTTDGCRICPRDTYQDDKDSRKCTLCPVGSYTLGPGKPSKRDCRGKCPKGTYSRTGLERCSKCPIGTYQSVLASRNCRECPKDHVTPVVGAVSQGACYLPVRRVSRLRIVSTGVDSLTMKWFRPGMSSLLYGALLGFDIGYHEVSVSNMTIVHVDDNKTENWTITGLSPSAEYRIHVWAITTSGRGLESTIIAVTENVPEIATPAMQTTTPLNSSEVSSPPVDVNSTVDVSPSVSEDPHLCPRGTNSPTGRWAENRQECDPCYYGFYQDETGRDYCQVCEGNWTTSYTGSTSKADCVEESLTTTTTTTTTTTATTTAAPKVPCQNGKISTTGFEPHCRPCPKNKSPNPRRKKCKWCPQRDGKFDCPALKRLPR